METPTKLIRLEDGSLVEVEASVEESERISGGRTAQKVSASFDKITPLLKQIAMATRLCLELEKFWSLRLKLLTDSSFSSKHLCSSQTCVWAQRCLKPLKTH